MEIAPPVLAGDVVSPGGSNRIDTKTRGLSGWLWLVNVRSQPSSRGVSWMDRSSLKAFRMREHTSLRSWSISFSLLSSGRQAGLRADYVATPRRVHRHNGTVEVVPRLF